MSFKFLKIMAVFLCGISACSASMTISGTRIIFPGNEKDVSVRTNNKGSQPALVQVWVDDGKTDSDINQVKVPFVVTPPVYRVEPGRGQSVRLVYNGM
ncbi:fimbria/pilus periplasmic chaperone, partial [Cronobacter sakazakii]